METTVLPLMLKTSINNILPDQIWMVVIGFLVAFGLAFAIGANDVANSFGTSVGSKVLTLRQACVLASICEIIGSVLLGAKVSKTIRKGIVNIELYDTNTTANGVNMLMAGQVAALGGASIWLLIATLFSLPVSGSHSIVGATMGFAFVHFKLKAVNWWEFLKIAASWFISPLLSGGTSVGVYFLMKLLVLRKEERLEPALRMLPAFYGVVVLVNAASIFYDGPSDFHFDRIPVYGVAIASCGLGCITALIVKFVYLPRLRRSILYGTEKEVPLWRRRLMQWLSVPLRWIGLGKKPSSERQDIPLKNEVQVGSTDLLGDALKQLEDGVVVEPRRNGSVAVEKQQQAQQNGGSKAAETVPGEDTVGPLVSNRRGGASVFEVKPSVITDDDGLSQPAVGFSVKTVNSLPPAHHLPTIGEEDVNVHDANNDLPEEKVFSSLQVATAIFGSFAHGGNDVSNAIGPLIGLWIIASTQKSDSEEVTPGWLLFYGGMAISIGLWVMGKYVMQTMGEDLTKITPSTGVCIEIGSALTVLVASKIGLPISTTHCKVGSVVLVGRAISKGNVQWKLFLKIIGAWVLTVPVSCGISAGLMALIDLFI